MLAKLMETKMIKSQLVIVFLVISICLAAAIRDDESSLLAVMARMTPNSILARNWSQGTNFCNWIGVTCSLRHLRVTGLDLFDMGLGGPLDQEIGNLSFLTYLDISNNSFNGQIPDEIMGLRRLRVLRMANNLLAGQIPSAFGFLINLERLNLSGNFLSGAIPWSVFNLSALKEIDLQKNQLSGTLPLDICEDRLRNLQFFRLRYNQIGGNIPNSLSNCGQLKVLDIIYNNFSGGIPKRIGNLSQLQLLSIGRSTLTGTIPSSIGNLSNLVVLLIRETSIQGSVPPEMGRLQSIKWMDLGQNMLNGDVPRSIFNLSTLQMLAFVQNQLSGYLPSSIGEGLPNLGAIYLGGNQFNGTIPDSITNLSSLVNLSLSFNYFSGLIPVTLGSLRLLEQLDLAHNYFTNDLSIPEQDLITPLAKCQNLNLFRLAINPISGELPKSIGSSNLSASLVKFYAFSCGISGTIPDEIGNLSNLILLALGDNYFEGLIPETLQRLSYLQVLDLSNNTLEGSFPQSLCNLKNIFQVFLEANKLSGRLPNCLGSLPFLKYIYGSHNAFSSNIPSSFWLNKAIQILDFSYNFFDGLLSEEMGNMDSLQELHLDGNQLSGEIPATIGNLQKLINISLSDNKFNASIPDSLAKLKSLQYLDLSVNCLSGSIPRALETLNLSYFNVSFNQLSGEIPNGGSFLNFTADSFRGNRALCGASRFNVPQCSFNIIPKPSRHNRLLTYTLPTLSLLILVAAMFFTRLFLKYRGERSLLSALSNWPLGPQHERISYREILQATRNFEPGNLIGSGGYGSVYKGIFPNGKTYAIKVFNQEIQSGLKSFATECHVMSRIRHRNIVKIVTSCSNIDFKALVMTYLSNGNLDNWLYSPPEMSLNIVQRMEIMIDVACAIEYLHIGYSSPIVHCDLKPSNILLDEDMVAHIGDFGIAKLLTEDHRMAQTKTLGSIGYMAPEYGSTGIVSTPVDVYSYGILLMETFTRNKPTDEMFYGELTFKKWVFESFPNAIIRIADAYLLNTDDESVIAKHESCLISIIRLALECTTDLPEGRPNMKDVLAKMKKIKAQVL